MYCFGAPSPQYLLHRNQQAYSSHIALISPPGILAFEKNRLVEDGKKIPPDSFSNQTMIDLAFALLIPNKSPNWDYYFNFAKVIILFHEFPNKYTPAFLAITSLRQGNFQAFLNYCKRAIISGNIDCMNLIGEFIGMPSLNMKSFDGVSESLCWFKRALRLKSIDSIKPIAQIYSSREDNLKALHLYSTHLSKNPSFYVTEKIALLLRSTNLELAQKLSKYCVSRGSISCLEYLARVSPDFWLPIYAKHVKVSKSPCEFFMPIQSGQSDMSKTLFSALKPPESHHGLVIEAVHFPYRKSDKPFSKRPIFDPEMIDDNDSESILFFKCFSLASENFRSRNLELCGKYIALMKEKSNISLFGMKLWKDKNFSTKRNDIISCGFIYYIFKKINKAYHLFLKAATLGSQVGLTMLGIIEFHGLLNGKRMTDLGIRHFMLAPTNPVALAHLAIIYPKESYLDRLKDIVNSENEGKIFEWVGDMFFYGVKLPKNIFIARMFYAIALKRYETSGDDVQKIIQKLTTQK
ncbi:hypothetical protein TRFO_37553 [Tritrichomonas foetus]|uniref:Uncharacterized protein n=1 Tax=Tritrichomonas foetus TaxID=1144522 RepID=A0A1J4JAU5_9EUKA|nr:hypothetical protein TRFO_37553 [Tritrichomonas foetus]|eukprot:OHS96280.1 hypothetical protein TRFO_37553 [Tritrichomonas foetus]